MLHKRVFSFDQECWISSRESDVNARIQSFIVECCVYCTSLSKLKVISCPFEIPPDTHDF